MPTYFIILFKINLALSLFAVAYYLVLRRLTFYNLNRVFLVFGILFSTIYPFINLTNFFNNYKNINQQVAVFVPKLNQQVANLLPNPTLLTYWNFILVFFYVGATLMALKLAIQFISLYKVHQKSRPGFVQNYPVRLLNQNVSPFSFWQNIYINPLLHPKNELNTILEHEKIHVKQWHTLDIILAELSVVFYWYNPGIWLMKRAVKENIEFITDHKILKKGVDKKKYQYSLLQVGNLVPTAAIVNNFNLHDLKKRIKMMNVKPSSNLNLTRYILVLPVLLVITLAFTVAKKEFKINLKPIKNIFPIAVVQATPTLNFKKEVVVKPLKKEKKVNFNVQVVNKDSLANTMINSITLVQQGDTAVISPKIIALKINAKAFYKAPINQNGEGDSNARIIFIKNNEPSTSQPKINVANVQVKMSANTKLKKEELTKALTKIIGEGGKINFVDSTKTTNKPTFYLNGKVVTINDLNINSDAINTVTVKAQKLSDSKAIYITTKEN